MLPVRPKSHLQIVAEDNTKLLTAILQFLAALLIFLAAVLAFLQPFGVTSNTQERSPEIEMATPRADVGECQYTVKTSSRV